MITTVLQLSLYLVTPALIMLGCKKFKLFAWLGPVVICYMLGISLGNLNVLPINPQIAEQTYSMVVPLAIILLLFSSDLKSLKTVSKNVMLSFLFCVLAALISSLIVFFIFKNLSDETPKIVSMLTGVFVGGTPNLAAIAQAIEVNSTLVSMVNIYEVVAGGTYLLFLMTFSTKLYSYFLPELTLLNNRHEEIALARNSSSYSIYITCKKIIEPLIWAISIFGICLLLSWLFWNEIKGSFIIPAITIGGVFASFSKYIRKLIYSFQVGEYLLLIFAISIGSICDFSIIQNQFSIIFYIVLTMLLCTVFIHLLFCYIFKIDKYTTIITSTSAIMSPPFVPAVAKAIGNQSLIIPGITAGILGNAIGSILGISVYHFFQMLMM